MICSDKRIDMGGPSTGRSAACGAPVRVVNLRIAIGAFAQELCERCNWQAPSTKSGFDVTNMPFVSSTSGPLSAKFLVIGRRSARELGNLMTVGMSRWNEVLGSLTPSF